MLSATVYDTHVEQLFDRIRQLHSMLTAAGIPYRVVGGMAVFIHISERDPIRARLTSDVDAAVDRQHLYTVIEAASKVGMVHRRVAGVEMLVDSARPKARSAVHLVFLNEKFRPESPEAVPASPAVQTGEGIMVASVADLVLMKLTSFRLKDRVHLQDLDAVGLITPEIERHLSDLLQNRLSEVRESE